MTVQEVLDGDAAAFLERTAASSLPPPHLRTSEQARARHDASTREFREAIEPVDEVSDRLIAGVPTRRYTPAGATGTTLYAHGGGWVAGSIATYDPLCRALANRSSTAVFSIEYDLAPEARHPRQLEQVLDVARALRERVAGPVCLAGDSAGGYLIALATLQLRREGMPLAAQALLYPALDPALNTQSARQRATGYRLDTETMRWYWAQYQPHGGSAPAAWHEDLCGLPPTLLLTAGFDPLRDDGRRYAEALAEAGVDVEHLDYPGQIHGFLRMGTFIRQAEEARRAIGWFLRARVAAAVATDAPARREV